VRCCRQHLLEIGRSSLINAVDPQQNMQTHEHESWLYDDDCFPRSLQPEKRKVEQTNVGEAGSDERRGIEALHLQRGAASPRLQVPLHSRDIFCRQFRRPGPRGLTPPSSSDHCRWTRPSSWSRASSHLPTASLFFSGVAILRTRCRCFRQLVLARSLALSTWTWTRAKSATSRQEGRHL
jgi:hypothetical protein